MALSLAFLLLCKTMIRSTCSYSVLSKVLFAKGDESKKEQALTVRSPSPRDDRALKLQRQALMS